MRARSLPLLLLLSAVACRSTAPEQPPALSVDRAMALVDELELSRDAHRGWYGAEGEFLAVRGEGEDAHLVIANPEDERVRELFDRAAMEGALVAAGVGREDAREWSRRTKYTFGPRHERVLLNEGGDLYTYAFGGAARRLTHEPAIEEVGEGFAPDGELVAFVSEHDLWVVGVDGGLVRALTVDGDEDHLYGRLDWLYQEEVYGRGNFGAYWWSPDSKRIALLVLDQTPVPEYTIVDHRKVRPDTEVMRYPKAGDPNPGVRVAVVDVSGGALRFVDLSRYGAEELLVVRVGWTPDGERVVVQVQDRIQTWLDVLLADPETGAVERLYRDQTGIWVMPNDGPWWIEGGERCLVLSERDGYSHLYLLDKTGRELGRLTRGPWEVDVVHGYDEARGVVWFSGDRDDVKGNQLYHVRLDGSTLERVSTEPGTHTISMAPSFELYTDRFSSAAEAPRETLHRASGERVRTLAAVDPAPAAAAGLVAPEFFQVPTRDGFVMEAMLVKPRGWRPGRRYPVVCHTYAGPLAPQVRDVYFNRNGLYHQALAQEGYLIWVCDNRSASGRGLDSAKGVYKDLGTEELADLEDGLDWLVEQGWADPERIALWGWSYGGYMTAFALTHSRRFKLGIVGAPVTDWRMYDTIYTERYMDTPQANPDGYDRSSPLLAAADLHGAALLIHGEIDENVHAQNTYRFAEALQKAGKPFQMMIYPGNRHGIVQPEQRLHMYQTMADFIRRNL
jgi:dipeptidyl-peptidase-4